MTRFERETWADAWRDRAFRRQAALAAVGLALALAALARFVRWVERRPGATLSDPLLALVEPRDVTWLTFSVLYAGLLAGLVLLMRRPRVLVAAAQAYALLLAFRIAVMWATPLDPPPGMIALRDPFVQPFATGQPLTRDLFFSGHTSTMALFALAVRGGLARGLFVAGTILVGACVLWQHVHYTVDVMAAPVFTWAAWRLVAPPAGQPPARRGTAGPGESAVEPLSGTPLAGGGWEE